MTITVKALLIIVSVLTAVFMSLGSPLGEFIFPLSAEAQSGIGRPPRVPEPSFLSVLALVGAYFISRGRRR